MEIKGGKENDEEEEEREKQQKRRRQTESKIGLDEWSGERVGNEADRSCVWSLIKKMVVSWGGKGYVSFSISLSLHLSLCISVSLSLSHLHSFLYCIRMGD